MGTQGEIYVVYGLKVEASVYWEKENERNPVIYQVGDKGFCDDEDFINSDDGVLDKLALGGIHYAGIRHNGYGALDPMKQELSVRILGHSGEYGGNMGARHFHKEVGNKSSIGKRGKALVGYAVSNASYMNGAEPVAPMDDIKAAAPKLIAEIKEKLGLDVDESQLGLHLVFDWLQGY
jgi:hypothetical protein